MKISTKKWLHYIFKIWNHFSISFDRESVFMSVFNWFNCFIRNFVLYQVEHKWINDLIFKVFFLLSHHDSLLLILMLMLRSLPYRLDEQKLLHLHYEEFTVFFHCTVVSANCGEAELNGISTDFHPEMKSFVTTTILKINFCNKNFAYLGIYFKCLQTCKNCKFATVTIMMASQRWHTSQTERSEKKTN